MHLPDWNAPTKQQARVLRALVVYFRRRTPESLVSHGMLAEIAKRTGLPGARVVGSLAYQLRRKGLIVDDYRSYEPTPFGVAWVEEHGGAEHEEPAA